MCVCFGGGREGRRKERKKRDKHKNINIIHTTHGEYRKEGKGKKLRVSFPTAGWVDDSADDGDDDRPTGVDDG